MSTSARVLLGVAFLLVGLAGCDPVHDDAVSA